jgi:quercetin dioxygenase-like cupin family protein
MALYRKKPVVINATQFFAADMATHANVNFGYPHDDQSTHPMDGKYWVQTLEGPLTVSEGDWIITGVNGEHYPCKPDIFEKTYEPA